MINLPFSSEQLRGRIRQKNGVFYISTTSFQEAVVCAYKAYLSKIVGLKPVGPANASLMFGVAVHSTMEEFLRTQGIPRFSKHWRQFDKLNMSYKGYEKDFENMESMGQKIVQAMIDELGRNGYEKVYSIRDGSPALEVQSPYKIDRDIVLTRTVDAFVSIKGVPTVLDFKTAYRMYSPGNEDLHSEQLTSYLLPHKIPRLPEPEQAMFLVGTKTQFPTAASFPVIRSPLRIKQFKEDVQHVVRMLREKIVPRSRSSHWTNCGTADNPYCEFFDVCYLPKDEWRTTFVVDK